jgi:hypothetical protein
MSAILCFFESTRSSGRTIPLIRAATIFLSLLPVTESYVFLFTIVYVVFMFRLEKWNWRKVSEVLPLFWVIAGFQFLVSLANDWPCKVEYMWQHLTNNGVFFAPFRMWFDNLGIFAIVSLMLCWFFLDWHQRKFYLASFFIFCCANIIRIRGDMALQLSVLYPLWMTVAAPCVALALSEWSKWPDDHQLKGAFTAFSMFFVIGMSASSVLGIIRQVEARRSLWDQEYRDAGAWIIENTALDDVFVAHGDSVEIVGCIAGRALYSVDGEWSKGIKNEKRNEKLAQFFEGTFSLVPEAKYVVRALGGARFANEMQSWESVYENSAVVVLKRKTNVNL